MKIINQDQSYQKEKLDVQRSIDQAIKKLETRLLPYIEQKIDIGKIFGDDVLIHNVINKKFYVFKCRTNQMQIRLLFTVNKDNELVIISHWYKNRTNNDYIQYFKNITESVVVHK